MPATPTFRALGAVILAISCPAVLPAQTTRDSTARDTLPRDTVARAPTALAAVRVTALAGALSPDRVPYAVTVVTPAGAAALRAPLALDDALRGVPGLAVDNRYNIALGERVTIRGFGARTQFGVRGVHIDVDGVPATMPDGQTTLSHVDGGTVASSEVLRGPGSSLYGNSAGGVVRLRTASPVQLGNDVRVSESIAEHGTVTTRATSSGTLGRWQGLARASALDYRGFRDHSNARDVRGGGQLAHGSLRDTLRLTLATADYDADNPGGLTGTARLLAPRSASATNLRYRTGETGTHRQAGIGWRHLGDSWSVDASAWGLGRRVANPIPQRIIGLSRRAAGGRVTVDHGGSGDQPLSLALGIEHGSQCDDRRSWDSQDGVRGTIRLDQKERVASDGVFARAALSTRTPFSLLAAARADRIAFHVDDRLVTATDPDDGGSRAMRALSPSIGVAWSPAARYSTYVNVSTAFETPTTTELANRPSGAGGLNPELAPQRVLSTELGTRLPLGSAGAMNFALFDARVRDALVPYELASSPGRQFYRNASRVRQRGLEGSASAMLAPWLLARGSATLIDARFRATDTTAGLVSGRRVPGVAPFRADAGLTFGMTGPVRAEIVMTMESRTPASDANDAWSRGYTLVDLLVRAAPRDVGPASVSGGLSLSNAFDRRYDTSVVPNAARGRYFEPGPPRMVALTVEIGRRGDRGR